MPMIILLIIVFILIALFEVPGLMRKKYRRDLIVFSFFLLFAFLLSLLQMLDVKIPSPMKGIVYLFMNVLHVSY